MGEGLFEARPELAPLAIRARGLVKRFGDTLALEGFSIDAWQGDLLGLLGPSGCGKTTALRVIAGFERPDDGTVDVGERTVVGPGVDVAPERRRVGMVFQDYALFPHMTAAANVAYGLDAGFQRRERVGEVLELVGLAGLDARLPHELSGGQQQRVALARALAPRPEVILLDEPFSNLDASLRDRVRREVRSILVEARTTSVFVTHDQEEALAMSDTVAVMRSGRVVQAGPPTDVYLRPAEPWVASFLGDADFLPGVASGGMVETPVGNFATEHEGRVQVMIRPEMVDLVPDEEAAAFVVDREFFGHDQMVTVALPGGGTIRARLGPAPWVRPQARVRVAIGGVTTFPDRSH
jgi:iron(III) transport system ATP-binding protein